MTQPSPEQIMIGSFRFLSRKTGISGLAVAEIILTDEHGKEYFMRLGDVGIEHWRDELTARAGLARISGGTAMDFGDAIRHLKSGGKVARAGWNGKGMWLSLSVQKVGKPENTLRGDGVRQIVAEHFWSENNASFARQQGGKASVLPCITMKTADDQILMGWLASQTDILAEDWEIIAA